MIQQNQELKLTNSFSLRKDFSLEVIKKELFEIKTLYKMGILFLFLLYQAVAVCYAETDIVFPSEKETLQIAIYEGFALLPMHLELSSGKTADGYFLVDTGCGGSSLYDNPSLSLYSESEVTSEQGGLAKPEIIRSLCHVNADSGSLKITDWKLYLDNHGSLEQNIYGLGKDRPILGVIGTDILYKKSFYLSLSKCEIGWPSDCPFRAKTKLECRSVLWGDSLHPELGQKISGVMVPVDAGYCGDGDLFFPENEVQKETAWYLIDTGTFSISSSYEDFCEKMKDKKDDGFLCQLEDCNQPTFGETVLPEFEFAGKKFKDVWFTGGLIKLSLSINLGMQILSRFDVWIGIPEVNGDFPELYLKPISRRLYNSYMKGNDLPFHYLYKETFGFTAGSEGIVDMIFYRKDGTAVLPEVQCRDKIISCDG